MSKKVIEQYAETSGKKAQYSMSKIVIVKYIEKKTQYSMSNKMIKSHSIVCQINDKKSQYGMSKKVIV